MIEIATVYNLATEAFNRWKRLNSEHSHSQFLAYRSVLAGTFTPEASDALFNLGEMQRNYEASPSSHQSVKAA